MIRRATLASRPLDQNFDQILPGQSMITRKTFVGKSKQKFNNGFQPQTRTTSVSSNPKTQNWTQWKYTFHWGFQIWPPTNCTLIPCYRIPLQVPTKTLGTNVGSQNDWDISETSASTDNLSDETSYQFEIQNTATFLQSGRNPLKNRCIIHSLIIKTNCKTIQL